MTNSSVQTQVPPASPQIQMQSSPYHSLSLLLKQLRLSHMLNHWQTIEAKALQANWSYAQFLLALCQLEVDRKLEVRLQRALSEAQLPVGKSFTTFEFQHCPELNPVPLLQLSQDAQWLERSENLILLGPSGVGKTHLAAAIGRSAIELGKRVRFLGATTLVQQLQAAKLQLQLPQFLSKLDRYDLLIVDDLGYVKKSEVETSVLFELYAFGGAKLYAHRYERKSLLITANQPFSQWDNIFSDSMMTVAAVDRLVHHALIIDI